MKLTKRLLAVTLAGGLLAGALTGCGNASTPAENSQADSSTSKSDNLKISVILNIEEDHLDFFKDLEDIRHSFHQFAALLPSDGTLVINGDIKNYTEIYEGLSCHVVTYGSSSDFDYSAENICYDKKGCVSFDLVKFGETAEHITLSVTGDHNVSNALSAIAVAELMHIPMKTIQKGLFSFTGTDRRFEYKGMLNGITIVDDYAHHPTEITATLKAAHHYPHNSLWCVFQPHTYTRTKAFFREFAEALSQQITSFSQIFMQPERQILLASLRLIWQKK